MKKSIKKLSILAALAALSFGAQALYAAESGHHHNMGEMNHGNTSHEGMKAHDMGKIQHGGMKVDKSKKMFLVKKKVDGYTVSFHVMVAGGMYHGGSHNLMIKIEQGDQAAEIALINSKVFFPDGQSESKMLIKMGDWYMNGYDLQDEGKHGMMVLFKTADGKKHKVSAYYPEPK